VATEPTGFVFARKGARGTVWCAKYRLPDGCQVKTRIGPDCIGRGRPPVGHYTKRLAEAWLHETLGQARRGTLPGMVRTGAPGVWHAKESRSRRRVRRILPLGEAARRSDARALH